MTTDETPELEPEELPPPEIDPRAAALIAAAGDLLRQADDAASFVPLDALEVDEDGQIDPSRARALVEELARSKPYLVAPEPRRRVVDFDAGWRGGTPPPGPTVTERLRQSIERRKHDRAMSGHHDTPEAMWSPGLAPGRRPGRE